MQSSDYEDLEHWPEEEEEAPVLPKVIENAHSQTPKRKEWADLGPKQKKRRQKEANEVLEWTAEQLQMPVELISKDTHETQTTYAPLSAWKALKLKDSILLSDAAYQKLRNETKVFPSLTAVKNLRKEINETLKQNLGIETGEGVASVNVEKAFMMIHRAHATSEFKLTFDGRQNEGREEVLIALIPANQDLTHSPSKVYPLMIYVGKEAEIQDKAKELIEQVNNCIDKYPSMSLVLSSDLKSFWTITNLKFKVASDRFCPFCCCQKNQIESMMRGAFHANERVGNFGPLNISLSKFIYCFLHCKMRITETILRHQIKGYYDHATNKQRALEEWTQLLQQLTGNKGIKVTIPKKGEDDRKFGDVRGLTGGMVKHIVAGAAQLGALTLSDRQAEVVELWKNWDYIIDFIETQTTPTPELQQRLRKFGIQFLDIFEWKILTAYAHILVEHTVPLMHKWGNIAKYSQEGLEAANKVHKNIARRATNHSKDLSVSQQLFGIYRGIHFLFNDEEAAK